MDGGVVYLAFSNKNAIEDMQSLISCSHCRNNTFRLIRVVDGLPLLQCAVCDSHFGRIGWADK